MVSLISDKKEFGTYIVKNLAGKKVHRLLEMGVLAVPSIERIHSVAFSYPIKIQILGYSPSLHKADTRCI